MISFIFSTSAEEHVSYHVTSETTHVAAVRRPDVKRKYNLKYKSCFSDKTFNIFNVSLNLPDGPALSLDINQPAANPAALAMAILSSAKSRRRTSSNPQVPLVIISQPLSGPITGQSSLVPQVLPEKPDQTTSANSNTAAAADQSAALSQTDIQTEVVLKMNQISSGPDESPDVPRSSTHITPLPVAKEQPTSEPRASEDTPSPEDEQAVVVVSVLLHILYIMGYILYTVYYLQCHI